MKVNLQRRITGQLADLIDTWLADLDPSVISLLPNQPDDLAELMAQQAVSVLLVLEAGESFLADNGLMVE